MSVQPSRVRGFTLVELAVVVAIIAVVATIGYHVARSGRANANVRLVAAELAVRLASQRGEALSESTDRIAVVIDAQAGGASCNSFLSSGCIQLVILRNPSAAWDLAQFDVAHPVETSSAARTAEFVEQLALPPGVRFLTSAAGATPAAPFGSVKAFDPDLMATQGGRAYFAIRFNGSGDVEPVYPAAARPRKVGMAAIFAVEGNDQPAAGRSAFLVGFPTGITRPFAYQE